MTTIDDYIKSEEQKMTWLDRLVRNYPKVRSTKSISHRLQDNALPEQTTIKPSIWNRLISMIILFFLSIVWILFLRMLLNFTFPFAVILMGFLFLTFIAFLLVRNSFFNKKYIYRLTFDREGVSIDRQKLLWADIADTYILNRQQGRYTNYYLVILKKDGEVHKLDLFSMGTYDRKLSTIVEYYKQRAKSY